MFFGSMPLLITVYSNIKRWQIQGRRLWQRGTPCFWNDENHPQWSNSEEWMIPRRAAVVCLLRRSIAEAGMFSLERLRDVRWKEIGGTGDVSYDGNAKPLAKTRNAVGSLLGSSGEVRYCGFLERFARRRACPADSSLQSQRAVALPRRGVCVGSTPPRITAGFSKRCLTQRICWACAYSRAGAACALLTRCISCFFTLPWPGWI